MLTAAEYLKSIPWRWVAVASVLMLAPAGCGGSAANTASKPTPRPPSITFEGRRATFQLASRVLPSGGTVPRDGTCDGANLLPPLQWGPTPANTRELVLLVIGFGATHRTTYTVQFALGGISPSIRTLEPGTYPAGAVLGRISGKHERYSICPPKGGVESFLFILYALPRALELRSGFDAGTALRRINRASSGASFGAIVASYHRI